MRKIIFTMALGALLLPDYGFTLGLGEIEVTTALNQELNAEIELLSAAPEDVETLIVKLASREEFNRAGIERPYLLSSLKFSSEVRNGVPLIRVTSTKPIREPFLNFLIEIDWPKGHMMREYTILLDPPVFMEQQMAPPQPREQMRPAAMESRPADSGAATEPQSSSGFRPAMMAAPSVAAAVPAPVPEPAATVPTAVAAPTTQTAYYQPPESTRSYQPPGGYRIQKGDTLWSLADAMRPDQTVSIEQMMLAMLRSNPEAFINGNVNGLKKGYILRIPDRDDIVTMNQADAVAEVREQHALWREYQQTVSGGAPVSAMELETGSGESVAIDDSGDARLEIVAAGSGVSASGSKDPTQMSDAELRAELAIARESLETERLEKEGLQQRVTSLEGQVDRMKSLLTLEDADLAEMQQAATPAEAEAMSGTEEVVIEEAEELLVDDAALEDVMALEEMAADELMLTEETAEAEGAGEAALEGAEEELFVDEDMLAEEPVELVEEMTDETAQVTEDFSVAPYTEPAFMQPQKQDPISMLLNNPMLLAAAGGGVLLVLLLIALIIKRRKSGGGGPVVASNLDDIDAMVDDTSDIGVIEDQAVEQEVAAAEPVAEPVDDVAQTEAPKSEPSQADTLVNAQPDEAASEPRDDVIAEADVYLAYGIYQQAEELLQNALKENPDKDSYRVKLAETYNASKNTDAFIEMATEMNQRGNGEDTPAWQTVAAIGQQLVPGHALFASAAAGDLVLNEAATSESDAAELDSNADDQPEALAPDLDLGFDEPESSEQPVTESGDEAVSAETAEPFGAVEFDLAETGADAEAEAEAEGVEFDLNETQAFEVEQSTQDTQEFSLDIEASELGIDEEAEAGDDAAVEAADSNEFDLDLSAEAEALIADDEAEDTELSLDEVADDVLEVEAEAEEAGIDTGTEDAVAEDAGATAEAADEAANVLDFSEASAATSTETTASVEDDDLDLTDLDDIDEVSTKLDLAKAYLDMGDADGTRSILDEVMTEGNDQQKKEADELLRQLG